MGGFRVSGTVFSSETVTDNATAEQAGLPLTGIAHVVVNGTVIVKDSKVLKDVYPGQPIRNDVSASTHDK